jgi:predicted small secreted protein
MRTLIKSVYASVVALVLVSGGMSLMGCNTTEGVGKDVEKAGEKLKDTAHDAKS